MTAKITREITTIEDLPSIDDTAAGAAALHEKLNDALTPGFAVEVTPDEADQAGAFREDALSEGDAMDSAADLADALEMPTFITEGGPSAEIPQFISTTNIRELFGWTPGETLNEAIARKAREG